MTVRLFNSTKLKYMCHSKPVNTIEITILRAKYVHNTFKTMVIFDTVSHKYQ